MRPQAVERKFPNGDFEIVMTKEDVPALGDTLIARGEHWTIVDVDEDERTVIVMLEHADASSRHAA